MGRPCPISAATLPHACEPNQRSRQAGAAMFRSLTESISQVLGATQYKLAISGDLNAGNNWCYDAPKPPVTSPVRLGARELARLPRRKVPSFRVGRARSRTFLRPGRRAVLALILAPVPLVRLERRFSAPPSDTSFLLSSAAFAAANLNLANDRTASMTECRQRNSRGGKKDGRQCRHNESCGWHRCSQRASSRSERGRSAGEGPDVVSLVQEDFDAADRAGARQPS